MSTRPGQGPAASPLLAFPKPSRRDDPNRRRKREIKRRDIAFQKDIPRWACCIVPGCPNRPGKHHTIKRRHLEYRWDDTKAVLICWPHHMELEAKGDEAFCLKYGLPFPLPAGTHVQETPGTPAAHGPGHPASEA